MSKKDYLIRTLGDVIEAQKQTIALKNQTIEAQRKQVKYLKLTSSIWEKIARSFLPELPAAFWRDCEGEPPLSEQQLAECTVSKWSSRVCELGTKSCDIRHDRTDGGTENTSKQDETRT